MRSFQNNPLIKLALFVFTVCCVITFVSLQLKFNNLKAERDVLLEEIMATEERVAQLENKLKTPFDYDYIIGVARDKLNLRLPEEIVFFNDLLK